MLLSPLRTPLADTALQAAASRADDLTDWPSSGGFVALLLGYRESGGMVRGDDLAHLLAERHCGDYISLARLIASGQVVSFEWNRSVWIPMFQFERRDLSVVKSLKPALTDLTCELDGWALAVWLVRSNARLNGARPLDALGSQPSRVVAAARADAPVNACGPARRRG